jgi:hypothetical protein
MSFIASTMCCGYSSACSSSCAFGMISLSTNSRTLPRISVCTSVSPSVWASLVMRDPASLLAVYHGDTLSNTAARPCPPPMHIVSSP